MQTERNRGLFAVSYEQVLSLFKNIPNPEGRTKKLLYIVGILFTPISAIGALWGYVRSYNRFLRDEGEAPTLSNLKPISRVAMILGAVFIWIVLAVCIHLLMGVFSVLFSEGVANSPTPFILMAVNLVLTFIAMWMFKRWQANIINSMRENGRYGSARVAKASDIADLKTITGMYLGGGVYRYAKQGHRLICASAGGGKFINLIAPALLDIGYNGGWYIIDPKAELYFVTNRFMRERGKLVLLIDAWGETGDLSSSFNPLDLVIGQKNPDYLIDDISIIAEMIVPKTQKEDQFWSDRARSIISGLLMHLVLLEDNTIPKTLPTIWKWLRLQEKEWHGLLADMAVSDNAIVSASANELLSIVSSERTYSSIMATAQDATDFLKSPALQKTLSTSDWNLNDLSDGNTVLYVVIPADKLESQSRFLRLMTATALRAVIRNKDRRVTFLLEEMAALGYMPEIKTALSTYRSYNVSVFSVFQDLGQIQHLYGKSWETFLSNSIVKQFFNVSDVFSLNYLSSLFGETTHITYKKGEGGVEPVATSRKLFTPDEIRRSGNTIFTLVEQRPVICFPKIPYYEMPELQGTYDANPHYTPDDIRDPASSDPQQNRRTAAQRHEALMKALRPDQTEDQNQSSI